MGGRGASGLKQLSGGGGASGKGSWSTSPNTKSPDTLREALGTKGRAMSITKAAEGANPYYNGNYREFSENCQRCVVAYEARRRGYNVVAQPTYQGDQLPYGVSVPGKGTANGRWQGAFQGAKSESVSAKTSKGVNNQINAKMSQYGDGSRAVIGVQWKNGKGGHVFVAERKNGVTYLVDPQVGGKYSSKVFDKVGTSRVSLVRTDNLKFSNRAMKSVEQAGDRTGKKAK